MNNSMIQSFSPPSMKLPLQAPNVDRDNYVASAIGAGIDPALFGLNWDDVKKGIGTVLPYAAQAAKLLI